jgi:predicted nucleic acid-binding protein
MSDTVVDSSVVAKWILPEPDSEQALRLVAEITLRDEWLVALDLSFPEVANAIWKRHCRGLATEMETRQFLDALLHCPIQIEPAIRLIPAAFDIAREYKRPVYDALFVALAQDMKLEGVTADEPLYKAVHDDLPFIILLRNWTVTPSR